jgi:hypothetical protein
MACWVLTIFFRMPNAECRIPLRRRMRGRSFAPTIN